MRTRPRPVDVQFSRLCQWLRRRGYRATTYRDGKTVVRDKKTLTVVMVLK